MKKIIKFSSNRDSVRSIVRTFAQQRLGLPRGRTEAYVIPEIRDDVSDPYI